jgi:hypothetical protein
MANYTVMANVTFKLGKDMELPTTLTLGEIEKLVRGMKQWGKFDEAKGVEINDLEVQFDYMVKNDE